MTKVFMQSLFPIKAKNSWHGMLCILHKMGDAHFESYDILYIL